MTIFLAVCTAHERYFTVFDTIVTTVVIAPGTWLNGIGIIGISRDWTGSGTIYSKLVQSLHRISGSSRVPRTPVITITLGIYHR